MLYSEIRGVDMTDYRLKIKVGDHEFDAAGSEDAVKSQFEAFKDLILSLPKNRTETTGSAKSFVESSTPTPPPTSPVTRIDNSIILDRIFRSERRVISLTAPPSSDTDAVLLVLYGQRFYRDNENPTGSEIIDGLVQSGYRTPRIDRILKSLADEGAVIITGSHRGKRYRLTNQGHTRAEGIAREILDKLPAGI